MNCEELERMYPEGSRVKIITMDDPDYDSIEGAEGEITLVEDGRIHICCE